MLSSLQSVGDKLARLLIVLTALGVAAYLGFQWLISPPDALAELQRANPGWTADKPRHGAVRLADTGGSPEVFVHTDHIGPLRLQQLDCAQLVASLPAWLRLPPGRTSACVQMGDEAPFTRVLNHRTPMPITELWTRHFEPHLDELKLPYWGGSTGGGIDGPASTTPDRKQRTISYAVDPAPGSADPQVHLAAFYLGAETLLIVTLRPLATP
jgi:hypothetical protein